ncbi:hypothetical protein JR316_0004255 [Psilocybe cubensis]|uniref:Uncharacterized protein n=2 Tax=Psilocybe cubensis TaxID=181762 RepID=A0ACB8H360_PSICU|nr:hypothetical protein JR316_0004255 [Psilocybe cubensis]KAH9482160.1 hypothetical protein JR316_0004255 [Psilocybe cubensis]
MPAPVVYVLAIVGTVGAVLAFKEFVYEPHISPAIDRWKLEYQAARRRREAANASEGDLLMSQTDGRRPDAGRNFDEDGDSDDDKPLAELGKGSSRFLKGGLLLRRQVPESQGDVELEDLVAREVSEWRNDDAGRVLRQRKNASENNAMDESIHAIPYAPLSPSRTHVVFDPSAPSTPASGNGSAGSRHQSLPHSPAVASGIEISRDVGSPKPATRSSSPQVPSPKVTSRPSSPLAPQPPPPVSPLQQSITQSMLLGAGNLPTPTASTSIISYSTHPLQHSYTVPSLSQSYPQDLDYEHGLELLSPPSSRSESPFSMAGMSPTPGPVSGEGLRALSPSGSASNFSTSSFSSAVSSPSPLRMGLGNESFDAVSPFLDPTPPRIQGSSVTDSARSTTYLSFSENSSEDEAGGIHFLPPPQMGASVGVTSAFGPISPPPVGMQNLPVQSGQSGSLLNARTTSSSREESRTTAGFGTTGNHFTSSERSFDGTFSTRSHSSAFSSPASTFLRPTPVRGSGNPPQAQSDADLSDLDLMSDYAPSESDFGTGNESDSSWSMAGGSAAASPRMGHNSANNAATTANITRGGTVRDSRGGRFVQR